MNTTFIVAYLLIAVCTALRMGPREEVISDKTAKFKSNGLTTRTGKNSALVHKQATGYTCNRAEDGVSMTDDGVKCDGANQNAIGDFSDLTKDKVRIATGLESELACLQACEAQVIPAEWGDLACCAYKYTGGATGTCQVGRSDGGTLSQSSSSWKGSVCSATPESSGDPHTQNVKGETFDIRREGSVLLLNIGDHATNQLSVTGFVQHLSASMCTHLFFTKITVAGTWLNGKTIMVSKNINATNDFILTVDGKAMELPTASADDATEHILLEEQNADGSNFALTISPSTHVPLDVRKRAFKVKAGDIKLQVETRLGLGFLDFYAYNLGKYAQTIGGIVGNDDHSEWALPTEECRHVQGFAREQGPVASIAFGSA